MASATSLNAATTPVSSTTSTNSHNHSNTASAFTSPGSSSAPRSAGPNGPATTAIGASGEPSAGTSSPIAEANAAELAAAAATATEETRQDLELKLKELIECLLELSITVYDFQPESNSLVHQKIQELIAQISEIDGFKDKLEMMVPMEVLGFIEDGRNPDHFTKSFIESVAGENQFTNGKITAMKTFEDALTQNLGNIFPEELRGYQSLVQEATTTSSGALTETAAAMDTSTVSPQS
ncbi:mediator of RNA polymerase II transcription subunit 10 [Entomortierella parvispora]|uniref:Mediator of RNA polymerase II transcription subunit 10 n=1 Tax=Entomortierella parvispora TaxID=205924 RepID=A0A9P3H9Q5_9FUNG|nr:mediator of RNA polymerase II transcription subunit 10 [Entomortierella parvispora]